MVGSVGAVVDAEGTVVAGAAIVVVGSAGAAVVGGSGADGGELATDSPPIGTVTAMVTAMPSTRCRAARPTRGRVGGGGRGNGGASGQRHRGVRPTVLARREPLCKPSFRLCRTSTPV